MMQQPLVSGTRVDVMIEDEGITAAQGGKVVDKVGGGNGTIRVALLICFKKVSKSSDFDYSDLS